MYLNCSQTKAVIKTILDESTLIESFFVNYFKFLHKIITKMSYVK